MTILTWPRQISQQNISKASHVIGEYLFNDIIYKLEETGLHATSNGLFMLENVSIILLMYGDNGNLTHKTIMTLLYET